MKMVEGTCAGPRGTAQVRSARAVRDRSGSLRRATPSALLAACLTLWPAAWGAASATAAAETVAAFGSEDGVLWLARDGELVRSERRRDYQSLTRGAAATADGRILEVYYVPSGELPGSGEAHYGGIDVLDRDGNLEGRWLFAGREFDGIAVDEAGRVWVSDNSAKEAMRIDLEDGSLERHFPLQTTERLQDIDAAGYFYLLAAGGSGWAIRIRTPEGAYVGDISLGTGKGPWVRVDADGQLRALVPHEQQMDTARLFTLLPDGEVIDSIEIPVNSTTFALTPTGGGWFGFRDFLPSSIAILKQITADGTIRQEIALPIGDEVGQFDYVEHVAVVPRAPRGSLCDRQRCSPRQPSVSGFPPGTLMAFASERSAHIVLRDGELVPFIGGGRGGAVSSFDTSGVAATPDGKILQTFYAELLGPDRDSSATPRGIHVWTPEGVEQLWFFQGRSLNGIAVGPDGNVWVSTPDHLLRVDLADGLIEEQVPLSPLRPELLQDIDGNGYFYLRASLGIGHGLVIRIRTPQGAHVRDISIEGVQFPEVRVDREGHLLVLEGNALYTVLPSGQVLNRIEVRASRSIALTPEGTVWLGSTGDNSHYLDEVDSDGRVVTEIVLPTRLLDPQSIEYLAFVPAAPRGSLCNETTCAPATPTVTPTVTEGPPPTATRTPSPDPKPTPSATVTVEATSAPPGSGGCDASGRAHGHGSVLPCLLVALLAAVRARRRRPPRRSRRDDPLRPAGTAAVILVTTAVVLTTAGAARAVDRYVNCCAGSETCSGASDSNTGTAPEQAWRTIQRAADVAGSGDVVHVFNGPCILEQQVSFSRPALSGPGDCTAGDDFYTIFRGDVVIQSGRQCDEPPAQSCRDGFVISGGLRSMKFEDFTFRTVGEYRFGESIKVQGGGNENIVFSNIRIEGDHMNAGVRILNREAGNAATGNIRLQRVTVNGVRGNGFLVLAGDLPGSSANISSVRIIDSVAVNNKPRVGGQPFCSGRCVGGANDGNACTGGMQCPDGLCTPSADGFVTPGAVNRTTDVLLDNFISGNNGDDGVDITNHYQGSPASMNYVVDSAIFENCKAGIRTWHSLQVENTHIYDNARSGIAVTWHGSDMTSITNVTIVGATLIGNNTPQIHFAQERNRNLNGRIYNTVVTESGPPAIALQYDRGGDNFHLAWDYNHFWRTQQGNVVRAFVDGANPVQCNHSQIPTCDQDHTGSHSNSISVDHVGQHHPPIFESIPQGAHNRHLDSSSLSWNAGVNPLSVGIATLRARDFDRDGHPRPRDGGYDMGAFEGSQEPIPAPSGCVGDCDGDGTVSLGDLQLMLNIFFGIATVSTCPVGDQDGDGRVTIGELQHGLNAFFAGCPPPGEQNPPPCPQSLGGGSLMGGEGGAGGVVSFDVETVTALPGGTAVVPISITGLPVLATGVQVDLRFDPSIVAAMECRAHPRLLGRTFGYSFPGEPDLPPDREAIRLAVYDPGAQASITDGPVFLCEFTLLGAAGSGSYELWPHLTAVSDVTGWELPHQVSGGAIIVAADALELLRPIGAVGGGLQEGEFKVRVASPPGNSKTITIESKTPALCVVGTSRTGSGQVSITRSIGASATESTPFYVKGVLGAEGTCRLEMRNASYTTSTGFVDVVKPAIRIYGLPSSVDYTAPNVPFAIQIGLGNEANTELDHLQETRPGQTFTINVHSSNPQAGVLVSPASGTFQASVIIDIKPLSSQSEWGLQFDPISFGMMTTVSAESAAVTSTGAASVPVTITQSPPPTPGSPGGGC